MNERYIEPTSSSRIKLALATTLAVAISVAMEFWWDPFMTHVKSLPLCDGMPWLRGIYIAFFLLFLLAGLSALRAGVLTLRSNQSPFPGAWIWSRTKVKKGSRAKFDGVAQLTVGALALLAPVAAGYWLQVYFIFCVPESCGCQ